MANLFGHDETTVHQWTLNSDQYRAEVRKAAAEIRQIQRDTKDLNLVKAELKRHIAATSPGLRQLAKNTKTYAYAAAQSAKRTQEITNRLHALQAKSRQTTRSLTDIKSAADLATGALRGVASGFDGALTRGFKYNNLQRNLTFSTFAAQKATKNLVDKFSLMEAASRSSAFGLNLNEKSFAALAKAATIAAKRMGIDTNQAIGDMITGMARMSPKILDNLGIIVKADDAYRVYAASVGKSVKQLTALEKQTAFTKAAMKSLNKIAASGTLVVKDAGGRWVQLKNAIKDAKDASSAWFASSKGDAVQLKMLVNAVDVLTGGYKRLENATIAARKAAIEYQITILKYEKKISTAQEKSMAAEAARLMRTKGYTPEMAVVAAGVGPSPLKKFAGGKPAVVERSATKGPLRSRRSLPGSGLVENPYSNEPGLGGSFDANDPFGPGGREKEIQGRYAAKDRAFAAAQKLRDHNAAVVEAAKAQAKLNAVQREGFEQMRDMGVGALSDLSTGLWGAADAAIQSGASFDNAMAQMVKGVAMGIAKESTMQAVKQLALAAANWYNPVAVTSHLTSAALWGAAGAAAGGVGLGISAATPTAGGSAASASQRAPSASSGSRSSLDRQPKDLRFDIRLERANPLAQVLMQHQISAGLSSYA
jgi:hypothetical protein